MLWTSLNVTKMIKTKNNKKMKGKTQALEINYSYRLFIHIIIKTYIYSNNEWQLAWSTAAIKLLKRTNQNENILIGIIHKLVRLIHTHIHTYKPLTLLYIDVHFNPKI